ncbi:hypothetical protein COU54_04330 [Candidatus Pacearchaeota archaeon CG10_big_fil_rev_8_21_14_0_10_31_24]|nr:MAG: hypothetical protein COU54_04330 [Candidatus Pacearchaeota archaeon CG10_big_fil_rev_8_21_14_0_10_31_24]
MSLSKPKLKVLFFIDTEADFYYNSPSPHFSKLDIIKWKLNKLRGKLYRYPNPSRNGFINIIKSCKKYSQKAIFCITGHLYLKSCNGFPHHYEKKPNNRWFEKKIGKDWYYWDRGGNYRTHPGQFLGDIIEKEKSNKLFEFGLHGFAHEALTLETEQTIDSIIKAGLEAAKKINVKITSFACPYELTDDEQSPNKIFNLLRKNKIKNIFHTGKDRDLEIKRYFAIEEPETEKGLKKLWISNYFEGTSSKKHIKKIIQEILKNQNKDATYCLGTHDFTHKNSKNLEIMMQFLKDKNFS